jgi:hypothetical protein
MFCELTISRSPGTLFSSFSFADARSWAVTVKFSGPKNDVGTAFVEQYQVSRCLDKWVSAGIAF